MRVALALTLCGFALILPAARAADNTPTDAATLETMAAKAAQAGLKDQCYLYAKLVRGGTALAEQELAAGDREAGGRMLAAVEKYAAALDTSLANDSKKLKDTEILLRESAFRLRSSMLGSALDDRPAMASALSRINADQVKIMGAVFAH